MGQAHIGMTVEDFYSAFDRREVRLVDQDLEGMFSPPLEVRSNGHVILIGEVDKRDGAWIIFLITVKDSRFHTTRGISVGSTYADLKRAYPGLKTEMEKASNSRLPRRNRCHLASMLMSENRLLIGRGSLQS